MRKMVDVVLIFILCTVFACNANAQYFGSEKIPKEIIEPWIEDSIQQYQAVYKFGFSEGECEMTIIINDDLIIAQTSEYEWSNEFNRFVSTYSNFSNVKIEGNKFFSDQTDGEFVFIENDNGSTAYLLIYDPWTYEFHEGGELGKIMGDSQELYCNGKFPQASLTLLSDSDLEKLTLHELKVMRNEIFARYSYKFKLGGEMDKYFKSQDWYLPYSDSANLTELEIRNIALIKKAESKKKE
ncbi:YARHG domain-containing protein [Aureibacter tunicatorum]|uniref:YARHG domain-containing protein n=1 Tax=Aureibacter tunicatorum TaxID=866807 RepID=A0AAE3XRF7_9BACT|nr:YARHG domain-containing protein [Aureibacter tunicatorum]MDR6240079.1 hypothetical protein [Aureibacter tunicatorum]BDD04550.1 hypothetical protein AUTU_20330 [Aureibacter tunicatorum]